MSSSNLGIPTPNLSVNIQTTEDMIRDYAVSQAKLAFGLGDEFLKIRDFMQATDNKRWMKTLRETYPEFDVISISDMSIFTRAAEYYDPQIRALDLPWCMYAYALRNDSMNADQWMVRAHSDNWKYSKLRSAILDAKKNVIGSTKSTSKRVLLPTMIYAADMISLGGRLLGKLELTVDINDATAAPMASIILADTIYDYKETLAISQILTNAVKEAEDFIGAGKPK